MLEKIFNSQVDLTELYKEPTYDELKDALENYLNPSDDEEEEQKDDSSDKGSSTSNIEDAFDKLFND